MASKTRPATAQRNPYVEPSSVPSTNPTPPACAGFDAIDGVGEPKQLLIPMTVTATRSTRRSCTTSAAGR